MTREKQDDWKRTQLRMPQEQYDEVTHYAEKNNFSLNTAILDLISKSLISIDKKLPVTKLSLLERLKNIENILKTEVHFDNLSFVASRLNSCIEMSNSVCHVRLTPSKVAERMGQESSSLYENYFSGIVQPSFIELESMANFFGVNKEWLKHGDTPIFNIKHDRLSLNPEDAVKQILNIPSNSKNNGENEKPKDIYLVRNDSEEGQLLIVRKYNEWKVDIIITPMHVSKVIGAGGTNMLKSFFVTLRILYLIYTQMGSPFNVHSYILSESKYSEICQGITHPLLVLQNANHTMWWEDIWDKKMYLNHEYWDGFKSISKYIQDDIEKDEVLQPIIKKAINKELNIFKEF